MDRVEQEGKDPEVELELLRNNVQLLERQLGIQAESRSGDEGLALSLRERIKELNCLYSVANLIERHKNSLDKILQGIVELLPISWQYPDLACARIGFKGQVYQTANFKMSRWKQTARISVAGQHLGEVEVYYVKRLPTLDEGPFLKEERSLINAISKRIGKVSEKIEIKKKLQIERQALQEANTALHDSLVRLQQEKKLLGKSIQTNIDKIITPILFSLKAEANTRQLIYISLLQKNLANIVDPFIERSRTSLDKLSPTELLICNMIKNGLTTKEIATLRRISTDTVSRHREHIRRKLGIANHKINLTSFLNSDLAE